MDKTKREKWEYKILWLNNINNDDKDNINAMNKKGQEGWEAFHAYYNAGLRVFLKRRILSKA